MKAACRARTSLCRCRHPAYMDGECDSLVTALCTAVWDQKELTKNVRLDDGTSDIDSLDSFEYTFERLISQLIRYG